MTVSIKPLIGQIDALLDLAERDALNPKVPHLPLELLRRARAALAQPALVITDEMIGRAIKAFDAHASGHDQWACKNSIRAALEAAALAHDEQAEPVAYQHRIRAATPGLEWGPWEDGRAPQFRTKAYEAQERPLYAAPVPEQAFVPDAGLVEFAKEMIRISFDGGDAEGSDIHETALRHGLLTEIEFDPEIHHDQNASAVAGDPWFVFAGPLSASPRSAS